MLASIDKRRPWRDVHDRCRLRCLRHGLGYESDHDSRRGLAYRPRNRYGIQLLQNLNGFYGRGAGHVLVAQIGKSTEILDPFAGSQHRDRALTFPPQGPRSGERKDGRRNVDANEIVDGGGELGAKCRRADLAMARGSRLRLRRCRKRARRLPAGRASTELPSAITY